MYDRALASLADYALQEFASDGNVRRYPKPPAFPDRCSLIALADAAGLYHP